MNRNALNKTKTKKLPTNVTFAASVCNFNICKCSFNKLKRVKR